MKIVLYMSSTNREEVLHRALTSGFVRHGDTVESVDTHLSTDPVPGADLAVFVGVRNKSAKVYRACRAVGLQTMMLDKGYFKRSLYHRVAVNCSQPLYLEQMSYDDKRFNEVKGKGARLVTRTEPTRVIYVEATQKYYAFHQLGGVAEYADTICDKLNATLREAREEGLRVVYRPKLSERKEHNVFKYQPPKQPPNTALSSPTKESFLEALTTTHIAVVHGSAAGVEAAVAGVPVLSLGSREHFPLHDLVNTEFSDILNPRLPDPDVLHKRLAQLAWCQFSEEEIASGFCWEHSKRWVRQ
jgi:hypothetical protein